MAQPTFKEMGEAYRRLQESHGELHAALEAIARGLTNGQRSRGETLEGIAQAALDKANEEAA